MPGKSRRPTCRAGAADLAAARSDFPVLGHGLRGRPYAYLDNAATCPTPRQVLRAMESYYETSNATVRRALYLPGEEATRRFEAARAGVARFLGAPSERGVVFTPGATAAVNLVAHGWGRRFVRPGRRIVVTAMEHHSNYLPWQRLARDRGAVFSVVPVRPDGTLDEAAFAAFLRDRPALVALTHVSNVLGTVNPVADWAGRARGAGARVLVDAAQSAGHRPVDFGRLGADFLVFSGHKMYGPMGTGGLVADPGQLERMDPFLLGGEMVEQVGRRRSTWAGVPAKFEAGTPPVAAVIGLGAAVEYLLERGLEAIAEREEALGAALVRRLERLPGVRIYGAAPERAPIVSFSVRGLHPHDLAQVLDGLGVAVRAGHLCAQPLLRGLGVDALTRASLGFFNTGEELDRLAEGIGRARRLFGHGS